MKFPMLDRATWFSALTVALMCVVACLGFSGVFRGWTFMYPVVVAAVGCTALSLVVKEKRLLVGEAVLLYTAGFFVLGLITTQWVPGLDSFGGFASAAANGWADLLTSQAPADLQPTLATVPFTVAWVSTALSQEFDRRAGSIALPLLGVLVGLVATSLFSTEVRSIARVQGPLFVGLAVLLALIHRLMLEEDTGVTVSRVGQRGPLKLLVPAGLLLVIGVGASIIGPRLPLADSNERFDLRQFQENPWDPLQEPSPLVTIKEQLKQVADDRVMFTVTTDTAVTRWPIARMASYSGVVWEVADPGPNGAAQFPPVDSELPAAGGIDLQGANQLVQAEIEIVDLGGVWVPSAGAPTSVDFGDQRDLRLNLETATLAAPAGFRPGDRYTLTSQRYAQIPDDAIERTQIAEDFESIELDLLPAPILNLADSFVIGIDFGGPQIAAIQGLLTDEDVAFYDVSDRQPPGHSYGRIAQFVQQPNRLVGYEEQYVATAGVLARIARIPTRVTVGYTIEPDRYRNGVAEIRESDAAAWIEVQVQGQGWIPVDVTPDPSNAPTQEEPGVVTEPVAVPNEPPPPPPPLDNEVPEDEEEEDDEDDDEEEGPVETKRSFLDTLLARPALVAGTVAASPLIGFALLGGLAAFLKASRTRKRKQDPVPRKRVSGAWAELVDRFEEAGVHVPKNSTPLELAERFKASQAAPGADDSIRSLATLVSSSAFAEEPPTTDETAQAWSEVDQASQAVTSELSFGQRLKMRVDPRPLMRRPAWRSS